MYVYIYIYKHFNYASPSSVLFIIQFYMLQMRMMYFIKVYLLLGLRKWSRLPKIWWWDIIS